ncbi:uncharacterized protein LOC142972823 [Anticarsia gemmatalis]|uniref:uncharacterized protein LOC142972823 n=1 Tax=Anticarsia gemmatalis TaxID=129554 RepID=UPI003F76B8C7
MPPIVTHADAEVEMSKNQITYMKSASVVTSMTQGDQDMRCHCRANTTKADKAAFYQTQLTADTTQTSSKALQDIMLSVLPNQDRMQNDDLDDDDADDIARMVEESMKTNLVSSCRYYSNLLTKGLGKVKDNLTKHLTLSTEGDELQCQCTRVFTNACTMKPSNRHDLSCQTYKNGPYDKVPMTVSCCTLSPTRSVTNICKNDKEHLYSVYHMLSSIEGRLRRLKMNVPN